MVSRRKRRERRLDSGESLPVIRIFNFRLLSSVVRPPFPPLSPVPNPSSAVCRLSSFLRLFAAISLSAIRSGIQGLGSGVEYPESPVSGSCIPANAPIRLGTLILAHPR
jgi:hypothetical protein